MQHSPGDQSKKGGKEASKRCQEEEGHAGEGPGSNREKEMGHNGSAGASPRRSVELYMPSSVHAFVISVQQYYRHRVVKGCTGAGAYTNY